METRNSHFEDHLSVVESAHSKTAGNREDNGDSLLGKIAQELGLNKEAQAPVAEGEVSPAEASVAGAAEPVVSATEAVTMPQTTIAGGNPAESAAGEVPAATKTNEGVAISAGDGKVTDANNLHKTPEAVAAAAQDGGGDEGSAAEPSPEKASQMPDQALDGTKTAEAVKIGQLIARSFQESLEKQAADAEYAEAFGILKEAGFLEGYEVKEQPMTKEASYEEGALEKLANGNPLSKKEVVNAAVEFIGIQKEAEYAEEKGREDARELVSAVAEIQKNASDEEEEEEEENEQAKIAAAINDEEVVSAVKILKNKGIL